MGQIHGDLSVMPLGDLVIWFANRGASGKLSIERGTVRKEFVLASGKAVRAASSDPREYFGQFLIHFGLLTEDQLQRAFETQRETTVLLGRILVMIGIVDEEQVIQSLRVKIRESMLDAFRWRFGKFSFDDAAPRDIRPEVEVDVPLVDIHSEGVQRAVTWDRFNSVFVSQGMLLNVNDQRVPPATTLDTLDGRIIALARHGLSIEAISLELHATDYQVAARLFELYRAGVIDPREPTESIRTPEPETITGDVTHAELARRALAEHDYSSAFRHVQASAKLDHRNEDLSELTTQIEGKYREEIQAEIVSRDAIPVLVRPPDEKAKKRLTPKQRYILARIDGKRSVHAIIQVSPMRDIEALEILRHLLRDGVIRL